MSNERVLYLVGGSNFCKKPFQPFSDKVINFLDLFSKELSNFKEIKEYPDLKTLSFWCRRKNIEKYKSNEQYLDKKIGLGLAFHITPSNIPTNFAYSLFFGLLSGNSNVVKVPSKNFTQIFIICKILKKIIKKNIFLKKKINVVKYFDNNQYTSYLSKICNVRIIWGGNKTINLIRSYSIQERTVELTFGDRYSFSIINANKLNKLNNEELMNLIKRFYNDTYIVDQNACTSPHLIIWTGKKISKINNIFWKKLAELVKFQYKPQELSSIEIFNEICKQIILSNNIRSVKSYDSYVHKCELKKLQSNNHLMRGKWGLFFEYYLKNLKDLAKIVNSSYQTLTYFGINKKDILNFVMKNNLKGIDRIVPIGQSLDISLNWDGYNVINNLTRTIELK